MKNGFVKAVADCAVVEVEVEVDEDDEVLDEEGLTRLPEMKKGLAKGLRKGF